MTRRWRMTALLALSFLAVPAARARAEDPEVQRLREELRKEIETNRKLIAGLADIQEIKNRLAELERRLDGLQGPRERVSRFGPPTATIRLENRLSVPATIIVD